MEEKIVTILNEISERLNKIEARLDKVEARFDEFKQENEEFKKEIRQENQEFRAEMRNAHETLREELKKEILDYMFLFEENYGRKINIMYEELTAKMQKDRRNEEDVLRLEKRIDKNSAFIFSHENRITTLERLRK